MKKKVTIIKPGDKKKVIYGAGDAYTYYATGTETDGAYFLFEGLIPPGGGPSPHIQTREEEAFFILEGAITFWIEDKELLATKGRFINMPKGVKHHFKNLSIEVGRILFLFAPAGIEKMFDELAQLNKKEASKINNEALNKVGEKYGVQFLS